MKLNIRKIERAKPPAGYKQTRRMGDGMGLYLEIRNGPREVTKNFVWRGTVAGSVTEIRLGRWPWLSLEEARDMAIDYKRAIRRGEDPRPSPRAAETERRQRRTGATLIQCAEEAFKVRMESARNKRNFEKRLEFLKRNAKALLKLDVAEILPVDIVETLKPIWTTTPTAAQQMRGDLKNAFQWAIAAGYRKVGDNPADKHVSAMLPKQGNGAGRQRKIMHYNELADAIRVAETCTGTATANRLAFVFMAHTLGRTVEVAGAEWAEIDLDAATWTVPADRMKAGREHVVPLNAEAMRILREAQKLNSGKYIFPSPQSAKRPIHKAGLTAVRKAAGLYAQMDNHSVRHTFKTWASECTEFAPDIIEGCLAHAVGGAVERAYNVGQALERRRAVMNAYCEFLTSA